jgi:uridine phosphorylase
MSKEKSELIVNPDGSIYHLKLKSEDIAETIIIVGDPQRVGQISKCFDTIELKVQNREFVTHTGYLNNKRLTVLATGIGTDNIDIVLNELDALANFNLQSREKNEIHKSLKIIRLGTSGAIQRDVPVNSFVVAEYGLGLDGLIHYYKTSPEIIDMDLSRAFINHSNWPSKLPEPYIVRGSDSLINHLGENMIRGITATSPGFYGPQGRVLRLSLNYPEINSLIESFNYMDYRVTNFEMETSALYGLGRMLGHETLTICAIIANRITGEFNENYKELIDGFVVELLNKLTNTGSYD